MTSTLPVPPMVADSCPEVPVPRRPRTRGARLLFGATDDPAWVRPSLLALLLLTGVLYIWGLGQSGWANAFYSAAAQAGSASWKAFFFGSSDAANSITVDKTPASLWAMALSARLFGVNSWSILVPQALMGVASVGLLFGTVRPSRQARPGGSSWPAPSSASASSPRCCRRCWWSRRTRWPT